MDDFNYKKKSNFFVQNIFWIAPIVIMAVGFLPMPYGYYNISRLIVCGCSIYYAYQNYKKLDVTFAWIFGFLLHDYTNLSVTGSLFEIDDYSGEKNLSLINLILPALTLSLRPLSIITQLTRNSLIDVLSMDYIRTATSKGLSKFNVLFKHALVNALNPVITSISGWFASLLAGSVFVEYIFGWNGIGKELVNSLNNLDVPVVMGIVLLVSLIFVFVNIVVDYLYSIIDPRIKM